LLSLRLSEIGFTAGEIARLHITVCLDIGAETIEQMALAVVGELLMVRSGSTSQSLRWVTGIVPSV
jgi:xanthine/CO dehydrogenase XdhC/CoxF family maturation factor